MCGDIPPLFNTSSRRGTYYVTPYKQEALRLVAPSSKIFYKMSKAGVINPRTAYGSPMYFCTAHIPFLQKLCHCIMKNSYLTSENVLLMLPESGSTFRCDQLFSLVENVKLECVLLMNTWRDAY
jgi:hypothetical protein